MQIMYGPAVALRRKIYRFVHGPRLGMFLGEMLIPAIFGEGVEFP